MDRRVPVRDAVEMLNLPVMALDIATVSRLVTELITEAEVAETAWWERTDPEEFRVYRERKERRDALFQAMRERIDRTRKRQRRSDRRDRGCEGPMP
jgi:hypothetical protein